MVQPGLVISFIGLIVAISSAFVAYLKYQLDKKSTFEKEIIKPLTSSREFYNKGSKIHENFSQVRIISKTPGLILPSEKDLCLFRKQYFQTITARLNDLGDYHLKYLFDLPIFTHHLKQQKTKGVDSMIPQIKEMLSQVISYPNLDLRTIDTEPLMGMVIGGESTAIVGFKEQLAKNLAEGILVNSSELIRVLRVQFDILFEKARRVDSVDFIDSILEEV